MSIYNVEELQDFLAENQEDVRGDTETIRSLQLKLEAAYQSRSRAETELAQTKKPGYFDVPSEHFQLATKNLAEANSLISLYTEQLNELNKN